MRRLSFFLKFYKTQKIRFLTLVLIFAFAAAILSCSLLVYRNNDAYAKARIQVWSEENALVEGDIQTAEDMFDLMERVMTIFAFGSVLIAVWGCTSILFFQNISMQKSHAMLRVFGMRKKDIFIRAWVEGTAFGLFGSIPGIAGGYGLFVHLSRKVCDMETSIPMFSVELLQVLGIVIIVFTLIAFLGSFISGLFITWDTVYMIDLDKEGEQDLKELLEGERCEINTAGAIVDELVKLLSDYWSIVAATGAMLVLVTGTFFYSMVRSDLLARKKEMYLYQIYGASRKKAFRVVYFEYVMIAWIASFCVLLVCAAVGGTLYKIILASNYPLSAPTVLLTVTAVTLFVLACCYAAQWMNFRSTKMEIIRDE